MRGDGQHICLCQFQIQAPGVITGNVLISCSLPGNTKIEKLTEGAFTLGHLAVAVAVLAPNRAQICQCECGQSGQAGPIWPLVRGVLLRYGPLLYRC
jgi:hypothetical protein